MEIARAAVVGVLSGLAAIPFMIAVCIYVAFISPFVNARENYLKGDFFGVGIMLTIGSWPFWIVVFALTR